MMRIRNPDVQRFVAAVLIALIAMSSQAWASHVDWPANRGDASTHIDTADDGSTAANADHTDHCSHASAHLVGLQGDAVGICLESVASHTTIIRSRYHSPTYAPLIDPPIA